MELGGSLPILAPPSKEWSKLRAMFFYRRQLRRWAARMLLLWLFGVGAGFANACLAAGMADFGEKPIGHAVAMQAADEDVVATPSEAHHASHAMQHHGGLGHDEAPGKTNCQDFCDKSTISIPPLKLALDHSDASALSLPSVTTLFVVPVSKPVEWWVPRRDGGLAPPLTIAFLRLAL